ncbi:GlxA family transcriptional regulator [Ectopseudomonas composti]
MSNRARHPVLIEVIVVVPPSVLLLDIAGPIEVLRKANLEQDAVLYRVRYVGVLPSVTSSIGLSIDGIEPLPDHLPSGALVVLPGTSEQILDSTPSLLNNTCDGPGEEAGSATHEAAITDWLRRSIKPGIRLVSICSGALVAARAGLLDGHDCTTHHLCVAELASAAPLTQVKENRLYVEDGERLTSAGITAGIDLMLHIVTQHTGHSVALAVARYLVVYLRRAGADPQLSPWLEGRSHIHPTVHRAQDAIVAEPTREWSVVTLAHVIGASSRNLSRLFNLHTGMSVTEYINRMRVALARELISGSQLDIETVAERAGFGSARQLRRAWARFYKVPPSQMRDVGAIPH